MIKSDVVWWCQDIRKCSCYHRYFKHIREWWECRDVSRMWSNVVTVQLLTNRVVERICALGEHLDMLMLAHIGKIMDSVIIQWYCSITLSGFGTRPSIPVLHLYSIPFTRMRLMYSIWGTWQSDVISALPCIGKLRSANWSLCTCNQISIERWECEWSRRTWQLIWRYSMVFIYISEQ